MVEYGSLAMGRLIAASDGFDSCGPWNTIYVDAFEDTALGV